MSTVHCNRSWSRVASGLGVLTVGMLLSAAPSPAMASGASSNGDGGDAVRVHAGEHRGNHAVHYGSHRVYRPGVRLTIGGGWWWPWPYDPYYRPPYYPGRYPYPYYGPSDHTWGALDLDVRPEEAQVYLDGDYVGIADNYDGYPRYLWLERGEHRLVFVLNGYETLVRDLNVRAGEIISLKDRLVPGTSTPADEYAPYDASEAEATSPPEATAMPGSERGPSAARDVRAAPARLDLRVSPADAAVYLDGRFLGTGDDLNRLHSGLLLDPGEHRIEASRPGYRTSTTTVVAEEGKDASVHIELEPSR